MMVNMEVSWLRVLLDNISSFLSLSSMGILYSNPAHKSYTRVENISLLLKPVLENLMDSDATPTELLNNGFEELAQYVDELREQFENWQPLSSRIFYVFRIESLASKLQESSLEVFQLLKQCEHDLASDLISPSLEECLESVKLVAREEISCIINQALLDQREGVGPTPEILVEIAESIGLRSNQEILIEGVVLANMKDIVELNENNTEAEFLDGVISLITQMYNQLTNMKQSQVHVPPDFRCPLSLELMTDPVIVASGQTYERVYIEKWIDMGFIVCPKTRQHLSHTSLTPNFIIKAFIAKWCESNNVNPPDPLKLIHSSQPFRLLFDDSDDSLPLSENSSPGNGHEETKFEELHQALSRSTSDPGIVSQVVHKTKADTSTSRPSVRPFRHPEIIPATTRETGSSSSIETEFKKLIKGLKSPWIDIQREATARIRILTRNSKDNRMIIAKCGAVKFLVNLLNSIDERIQADAVTSLLNLSINDNNKSLIVDCGAIKPLIHVLKTGILVETKDNSATTLFSLSLLQENKAKIVKAGAIEPLVDLLRNGSLKAKKDAVMSLFNLSMQNENKSKIIRAGAVRHLVELMVPATGMVERAVVVLANLATAKEGKIAIAEGGGIPVLVEVVELGSPRGKENATAALYLLSAHNPRICNSVIREGAIPPLVALTRSGTVRAKEKAENLLKCFKAHKENNQKRS